MSCSTGDTYFDAQTGTLQCKNVVDHFADFLGQNWLGLVILVVFAIWCINRAMEDN